MRRLQEGFQQLRCREGIYPSLDFHDEFSVRYRTVDGKRKLSGRICSLSMMLPVLRRNGADIMFKRR